MLSNSILETLLNQTLALDSLAARESQHLIAKDLGIILEGVDIHWYLVAQPQSIQVLAQPPQSLQAELHALPFSLLRYLLSPPASPLSAFNIHLSGNHSVAMAWMDFLRSMEIDWEALFAQILGDVAGHGLNRWLTDLHAGHKQKHQEFEKNLVEFLQEERHLLPSKAEVDVFMNEVDSLRDDLERLEQRIDRAS
ncbi:hypothetical protein QUF61_13320 [Candidatus Venteria ishoeyi]|uniref:ubiquinone biosynthesis accessory factor UbiJ n=1 Tax=Candidatus Venteria ishoeyi TaxID=1899563 RepID=UPI0025A4FE55|nr:hypothetical protein [Candidatus Venteria ishoeyi]MDM8547470.1 hypothetical protein [Candidatus Venteria ishoeyi]